MHALDCVQLSKTYKTGVRSRREVQALQDLTLSVDRGEIFSLLGPNGAGKTTCIKILLSLVHPTTGSASLLGLPVSDPHARRRIGYLPENHRFPGYLTGEQVLTSFGALAGVRSTDLASRTTQLLGMVGMQDWRKVKVKRYSKGMMQRLGLAQALINDPDVLFLDEPTDGVDPVGRKEIRDVLRTLKAAGKTIFLNSHLLSEVELVSDRVAILDHGKLLKVGTVDELTVTDSSYQIGVEGAVPEAFLTEATARVLGVTAGPDGLITRVADVRGLNAVIDLLRTHGVSITSIQKQRSTLEESFINLITREIPS
ncbi:MAG: ABC transporter ATP-binding protein [Ignavibacteriae bacterium]|nr:ABC transporter ATP-binding protein [Ignavibacteriota bacterium]